MVFTGLVLLRCSFKRRVVKVHKVAKFGQVCCQGDHKQCVGTSSLEKGRGEKPSLMYFVLDIQGFGTQKAAHTFLVFNENFDSTLKRKVKIFFYFKKHN